ncbi:MAG: site-specific DNA-methyltransferase [Campylobacterales bacterium]|nr:site-specific DNA-methyltransferase [Campylobacterales bacterium]
MATLPLYEHIKNLFKNTEFVSGDGEFLTGKIFEAIERLDKNIIAILLKDAKTKEHFFISVEDAFVLDQNKLFDFFNSREYFDSSYTSYTNKIGLIKKDSFIKKFDDVVLAWPYKDCVLEGGMSSEDKGKNEVFYNSIISKDEIDRLFEPKVLTNIKKYTKEGATVPDEITMDDNLIIKGNNLLALHSLKKRYAGKVKLIYIDPPYNTGGNGDTFLYNNNFKRSTWLTFMKNRMEVAKQFLSYDGSMIIAIDKNEQAYLGVLIDEVFSEYENHCVTIVHNPRGTLGTNFSYTHEYAFFIIPKGQRSVSNRVISADEIEWSSFRNWGSESLRTDAKNCFYSVIVDKCTNEVIDFGDVCADDYHPNKNILNGDFVEVYPIDKNGIERKWRYARQSVEDIKHLLRVKSNNGVYDIELGKDFGTIRTVWIDNRYDANEYGTKLVRSLVPNSNFSFPKSLYNVFDCISAIVKNDKNAIVLDFHAGSGTTAHAVLDLNKEDGGNRKFILVEQMDYIETVTTERVKKVIEKNGEGSFVYAELKTIDNFKDENTVGELNKNMQYLPIGEMDDEEYGISEAEKKLNKHFYGLA